MNKEEYNMISQLLQYAKACRLIVEWAEQCDFGFDNFRDDTVVDWAKFEKQRGDMGYTESLIFYANMYLHESEEPYVERIRNRDISELTFDGQMQRISIQKERREK